MPENFVISVYNYKGGCGKTVISYALAREFNALIASNENNIFTKFYKDSMKIDKAENLPVVKNAPIIYDFGGFAEAGIIRILKASDIVIVPTYYDDEALSKTVQVIKEIRAYNPKIIIAVTRTEGKQFQKVYDELEQYFSFPIINMRKTTLFLTMTETGKSLKDIANENKRTKKAFGGIKQDFKVLKKIIKEQINGKA
jgi:cellulose biosynthesis protein BcsQ